MYFLFLSKSLRKTNFFFRVERVDKTRCCWLVVVRRWVASHSSGAQRKPKEGVVSRRGLVVELQSSHNRGAGIRRVPSASIKSTSSPPFSSIVITAAVLDSACNSVLSIPSSSSTGYRIHKLDSSRAPHSSRFGERKERKNMAKTERTVCILKQPR